MEERKEKYSQLVVELFDEVYDRLGEADGDTLKAIEYILDDIKEDRSSLNDSHIVEKMNISRNIAIRQFLKGKEWIDFMSKEELEPIFKNLMEENRKFFQEQYNIIYLKLLNSNQIILFFMEKI